MTVKELQTLARARGIKVSRLRKAQLIHAIQNDEGNFPCFGTASQGSCDQTLCAWKTDCVG